MGSGVNLRGCAQTDVQSVTLTQPSSGFNSIISVFLASQLLVLILRLNLLTCRPLYQLFLFCGVTWRGRTLGRIYSGNREGLLPLLF